MFSLQLKLSPLFVLVVRSFLLLIRCLPGAKCLSSSMTLLRRLDTEKSFYNHTPF